MADLSSPARPRVLLIEDDLRERELLAELLSDEGISIVGTAGDGAEGVALARELRPDVVLTDLRMPVVGGIETTRLIKEDLPTTQVILLTAYDAALPSRSAEDVGAYAYLVKGCSVQFIRDIVGQAVGFKAGLDQRDQLRGARGG